MAEPNIELIQKVRQATGLVRIQGPITWAQQQMIEKLPDPFAKRLVGLIQSLDVSKREWEKVLTMLAEEKKETL